MLRDVCVYVVWSSVFHDLIFTICSHFIHLYFHSGSILDVIWSSFSSLILNLEIMRKFSRTWNPVSARGDIEEMRGEHIEGIWKHLEEVSWRRYHEGGIMEEASGGGIMRSYRRGVSWTRYHEIGMIEEASGGGWQHQLCGKIELRNGRNS